MKIVFIVPCYNEARRLKAKAFKDFMQDFPQVNFLFVNDGSTDKTLEFLRGNFDQDKILNLENNSGKAEAVRMGMRHFLGKFEADYIGFFDADLATPLSELPRFCQMAEEGKKIILGSRVLRLGGNVKRKWYRHYLGRVFATVASQMLALPVYDTQCGAKLFQSHLVGAITKEKFISKWIFDVELLLRLRELPEVELSDYVEIPLERWEDIGGSRLK